MTACTRLLARSPAWASHPLHAINTSIMAPKSPSRSTSRPSLLSRARSFTKSASFSRSPSFSKKAKPGPVAQPSSDVSDTQVRYVMVALPVDGGAQFMHTVDDRKIVFTAPLGKKLGDEHEFAFTYASGEVKEPAPPPAASTAAAEAPPAKAVAAVADEPVLKASAEVPAAKVAEVPPGYYAPLAREVTESAIKAAIEISKPAVTGVADEPMVKAAAPPAKPVAAPPAKLVAALPAKPAEAAAPSLAKWQEKEAEGGGGSFFTSAVGVVLLSMGVLVLLQQAGMLDSAFAPPPLPPPPPAPKFLGIF